MSEINPNHAVTKEMHDNWHKVVAVLMQRFGLKELRITPAMLAALPADLVVAADTRDRNALVIRVMTAAEAEALVRQEGGLPH